MKVAQLRLRPAIVLAAVIVVLAGTTSTAMAASPNIIVGSGGTCSGNLNNIHNSTTEPGYVSVHSQASCSAGPVEQISDTTELYWKTAQGYSLMGVDSLTDNNKQKISVAVHAACPSPGSDLSFMATEVATFTDSGQTATYSYHKYATFVCY